MFPVLIILQEVRRRRLVPPRPKDRYRSAKPVRRYTGKTGKRTAHIPCTLDLQQTSF